MGAISGAMLLTGLPATPVSATPVPTADSAVFSTQPGDGSPGTALSTQPKVHVEDASNANIEGASVTLSLDIVFPLNQAANVPALTCDHLTVTTDSSGDASFAGCKVNRAGQYHLVASVDSVSTPSDPFDVSGESQLTFNAGLSTTATAGVTLGTQPIVTVKNTDGSTVDTSHNIGLVLQPEVGSMIQLPCTSNPVAAVHGVATFGGCKINAAGDNYKIYAVDTAASLIGAPSPDIDVSAGTSVSTLAFTQQPSNTPGGTAFGQQPVVKAKDAGGNAVPGFSQNVTLSIVPGTGTSGAQLTCNQNPVAASNGVATFAGCKVDKAGTGYRLKAEITSPSLTAQSSTFDIASGTAAGVAFGTQPSDAHGGSAFGQQPVVNLTDSGGNPVNGTVTLSIDATTNSEGATLTCAANPLGTSAGHATFSGCSIDKNGSYQLIASDGTHTAHSDDLLVSEGGASQLVFNSAPTSASGGSGFSTQPSVYVRDSGGNAASGTVELSLAPGGAVGATLTCSNTDNQAAANGSGLASFSGCKINKAGTGYRLKATLVADDTVLAVSNPFDVAVGSASQLAFVNQPGGGAGGEAWEHQPAVAIEDAGGNLVSGASATITLTRTPGQGSGTLTCKDDSVPTQNGVARFDSCAIDTAGTGYTLTASGGSYDDVESHAFDITPGDPAALVFSTQPSGASAGGAFTTQPVVQVVDKGKNVIDTSATIALSLTPGTGTAGASLSCGSLSASHGVASYGGCSIDQAGGGYVLTATDAADHLTGESLPFSVLLAPPAPLEVAPTALPVGQTFGGSTYGANPSATTDNVNTATGALSFSATDLRVAGLGLPLVVDRTYNSLDTTGGVFGPGWSSIFDISVKVVPGQTETVRGEDGQQLVWKWNAALNRWDPPAGVQAQLTCGAKTCKLIRDDNIRWDVNLTANGRAQIVDYQAPDLQGLTFVWSAGKVVVTLANKAGTITALLNPAGQITSVTTSGTPSRSVSYAYDGNGLLTSATDALNHTWTYAYAGSRLTSVTDPLGHQRLAASYDGAGKVAHVRNIGSERRSDDLFTYTASPQSTTRQVLTSVNGGSPTRQSYVDRFKGNVLVAQVTPSGATTRYSYDANLHLTEAQDALGWTSTYTYDQFGNLTSQTVPISSTQASTVRMGYDGQHRITSQIDANGNQTTYTYNGPWLSAIKPPATGNVQWTRFDYDGVGHLVDTVGPTNKRLFTYDARGNMTSVKVQDLAGKALTGAGTTFTYDEAGDRLTSTDPNGHKTSWSYDAAGRQTQVKKPDNSVTNNTYDAAGDLISTATGGHTTSWSWNEGAGTRTTSTDGTPTLRQTYDANGNLLSEVNPNNADDPGTTYTYDVDSRQVSKTDSAGITTFWTHDDLGNVVAANDTVGQVLTQSFNAAGKLVRRNENGRTSSVTYDLAGNTASSTDGDGNTTRFTYNADGLVSSAQTAAGTATYGYDNAGNLVTVRDPGGHTTSYAYDALARKTKATTGGTSTSYVYDLDNNLVSTTDPDGRKTTYTLDSLHRVTKTVYTQTGKPSITVNQAYDALGRRISLSDNVSGAQGFQYDDSGNLKKVTRASGDFTYDWTTHPGQIAETYPDGTDVTYTLDDRQKLMSVTAGTKGSDDYVSASYLRDARRQTVGIAFANGVLDLRKLDQAGDVVRQTLTLGGETAADDSFTYDPAGNPLSQVHDVNGTVTTSRFGYDGNGRLNAQTQSSASGGTAWPTVPGLDSSNDSSASTSSSTFAPTIKTAPPTPPAGAPPAPNVSYDADGNRTSITTGAGTTTGAHNGLDQLTSQGGATSATFTYDLDGNLTRAVKSGQTTNYGYDAAGRLVSVAGPSGTVTYTYDGDGNRVSRTTGGVTTELLWDPANDQPQLALEKVGSTFTRRYIHGEGPVAMQVLSGSGTETYFFHLDPQGNVTELTGSDGSLAAAYRYDAFGNATMDAGGDGHGNELFFQSEYLDPTSQLYYMKARNYDASTGRFTQRDPKDPAVGAAVMTPYNFASDRPTALSDPKGESPETDAVFWSHNSEEANIGNDTKLATSGLAAVIKGGMKLNELLTPKAITATDSLATSVGAEARAVSTGVRSAGVAGEEVAAASKEASAAGEALGGAAKAAKFAGIGLAVAGIGLQAFVTVEDCMHDTAYVCAADVVGLTISVAFTVGCEFVSAGAASVACAIIGGALAVAIPMLITKFGPQAVAAIIDGYNIVAGAVEAAIPIIADAINTAIDAVTTFAEDVGGAIVSGFNQGLAAVTSGFWDAVDTLRDAGYSAVQLATTLANAFAEGVGAAVATLVDFGYQIGEIATALADALGQTAAQAATWLKDTFNYTVAQVANALKSAYDFAADAFQSALAGALKAAGYAIDEVVTGLKTAYAALSSAVTAAYEGVIRVLDAINYGINEIAGAIKDVYNAATQEIITAFHNVVTAVTDAINYTVDQVAGVLKTVFNQAAAAAMAIFKTAGYLVDQAAQALNEVFHTLAAEAAKILDTINYALNGIADALADVWHQIDTQVAQIFQSISKTAAQVTAALQHAFTDLANDVANALQKAGYLAQEAMAAVEGAFNTAISTLTGYFQQAGYVLNDIASALHSVFSSQTAAQLINVLEGVFTGQINLIATALAPVFSLAAAGIAQALADAGKAIEVITSVMRDAFAVAQDAIAGILTGIKQLGTTIAKFTVEAIAGVLQSIYNLAADVVAGLLQLAGWAVDAINAIGGAFVSFGQSIADGLSDAWDTVTSWF